MKYYTACAYLILASLSLPLASHASKTYECWSYKGKILGELVFVSADDKGQAAQKAAKKFDDFFISYDNVKCK